MPVPKRRKSKSRRDMRRAHHKAVAPSVNACPKCSSPKLPHRVCLHCGHYKGKEVVVID